MRKRILSALLAAVLLLACAVPVSAASYSDISGHWASAAIMTYSNYGIIQGANGKFRPDDSITRAELATVLGRLFKWTSKAENTYTDLPEDAWYTEAVLKAAAAGVMTGADKQIRPTASVTRQEAAVMFVRAFSLGTTAGTLTYSDAGQVASWAKDAVTTMTALGYLRGADGKFNPTSALTRAQAVTMLNNIISRVYDYGGITTKSGKLLYGNKWYSILPQLSVNVYNDIGTFKTENGRTSYTCNGKTAYTGVDVSFWQGDIDWAAVAADGITFAMIRLGYRSSDTGELFLDTQFENNIRGALENGIQVGVYFFSQAITEEEAIEEALFTLSHLEGYEISYPIVYDWEPVSSNSEARTKGLSKSKLNACAAAYLDTIAATGYTPMLYTNKWYAMVNFDLAALSVYDLWFAGTTSYPTLYYKMQMWQYSETGKVNGIDGAVDLNLSFVDYASGAPLF